MKKDLNRETGDAIYFYTPEFYSFDNFAAFRVKIWGRAFATSEHAYQWKKFSDNKPEIAEEIFNAGSPNEAKNIADMHKDEFYPGFHEEKLAIMEEILRAKADQNKKFKKDLIESGNQEIIENSPIDYFWGIGSDGSGQNHLGKILMKLRKKIQNAET